MKKNKGKYDHLIKNLEIKSLKNSIFNNQSGRRAFLSLGQGNIHEWLETLLPNTRLILEPRIIGSIIAIQYINGSLVKAIDKNSRDITNLVKSQRNVPKSIPIKKRIEIKGVLYENQNTFTKKTRTESFEIKKESILQNKLSFCAFHIFHCKINQFQALNELKNLDFEIPETQSTKFISDIEIYLLCWKEGKLFQRYPTKGLVLKINSKKLQKSLGENNLSINWAYAIN